MQDGTVNHAPALMGWKEIASYLNMGVRTVQRYETTLRLRMGVDRT